MAPYAVIMAAFPGISLTELREMDWREQQFWLHEAPAKHARDEARLVRAANMSMAAGKDIKKRLGSLDRAARNAHKRRLSGIEKNVAFFKRLDEQKAALK